MDHCVNLKSHTQDASLLLQSPGFDSGSVHEQHGNGTGFYLGTLLYCVSIVILIFHVPNTYAGSTRWCNWLRHSATSQKVAGLIPDGVIGIFH